MGLAGAEEAGDPDAHLAGDVRIVRVVDGIQNAERNLRKCLSSSLVNTNSSNSCQTEKSSSWWALTTPLIGAEDVSLEKILDLHVSASSTKRA